MSVDTDLSVLDDLDFDIDLPCEAAVCTGNVRLFECSVAAKWRVRKGCCGAVFLACEAYRTYALSPWAWTCAECRVAHKTNDALWFTPIRDGAL